MRSTMNGMQRKTIKKTLEKKLSEWIDSIEDESVKKLCKKHTIVTGGAIASMLLGETINDYDVYFRNKETTLAVAKYYVDKFNDKNRTKVAEGVNPYQPYVKEETISNIKKESEDRVVIMIKSAGVAGETEETYKYFESEPEDQTEEYVESVIPNEIEDEKEAYRPIFLSQNAISLSRKIQIVIRFYGEPNEIHNNYDFIHAMNYYDFGSGELVTKTEALESLMSRTLIYSGSLYPVASIFRAKKFINRGWKISAGQLLKIMWQISEIDLSDFETAREQLTGVDQAYLHQVIAAIGNIDQPEKINSTYIGELIDRIFGDKVE